MRIFLDFDGVLHNTRRMIKQNDKFLLSLGIDPEEWRGSWKVMYEQNHHRAGHYSVSNHLRQYRKISNLDEKEFLAEYENFHRGKDYLFVETRRFIKRLKKISEPTLITHGDHDFQMGKIKRSGTHKLLKRIVVVPTLKAEGIGRLLDPNDVNVMIDDNPFEVDEMKRKFPQVVVIHMNRSIIKRWAKPATADFYVNNLNQALVIMELLNDTFTKDVKKAVQYLKKGRAVVYPTDTAYGLGVDATNARAVRELYRIKNQSLKKPTHIIVSDLAMAKKYAVFDRVAEKLFKKFMPGALTLVLPLRPPLHLPLMRGRKSGGRGAKSWEILSAGTGTIGIRMPDNKIALHLVKKLGRPITTTSANPHGGLTAYSAIDSFKQFFTKQHQPDLYLDSEILPKIKPSTMVQIKNNKIKILRKGPINV